jgi:predicted DNA-binding transcriptional regulator YafY
MAFRVYDEFRKGKIERKKDGFYIQVEVPESEWMYAYFFGFGNSLEILGPERIRHGFFRYIKHIAKKYK